MSDVVAEDGLFLFHCFRDPVFSGTNEEGALRLLGSSLKNDHGTCATN